MWNLEPHTYFEGVPIGNVVDNPGLEMQHSVNMLI